MARIDTTRAARYVERMISLEEARALIAAHTPPASIRTVMLGDHFGFVLQQNVVADAVYPPVDRAMMDGYALAADDPAERFTVAMEIAAGKLPERALRAGECARIFTGAALPPGATQVIPQEDTRRESGQMIPLRRNGPRYVRPRGSEAQPGDVLLRPGTLIGGPEAAILASVGAVNPRVSSLASVRHFAVGDELVDPEETPGDGEIRDSNSTLLKTIVLENHGLIVSYTCDDDLDQLSAALSDSLENACEPTLLLISGGASVGDYDFGAEALRRVGFTIHFDQVNLRPGKPLTFATREGCAAFVLPGNPISHFVCFYVAVRLALEVASGRPRHWAFVDLPLGGGEPLRKNQRETFWPARVVVREGALVVVPKRWSSSGDTFALAGTNALIRIAADTEPGGVVPVLLLDLPGAI